MLKLHSFKMADDKGMNDLLEKNRIAQGAAIMVSNGDIVIPVEDGEPLNTSQLIIKAKEERNTILVTLLPMYHSQKVLVREIEFLTSEIERLNEEKSKLPTKGSKEDLKLFKQIDENIKSFENMILQKKSSIRMNDAEIRRMEINVEIHNEYIEQLTNTNNE